MATITAIASGLSPVSVTLWQEGSSSKTLTLTCFLEGPLMDLYVQGISELNSGTTVDQVIVELYDPLHIF
ncbi:MAG: hypothetical protein IPH45_11265 [Bacteroidales bacterium]|nr:hypothetical protein [Bacteroidales bacterium]